MNNINTNNPDGSTDDLTIAINKANENDNENEMSENSNLKNVSVAAVACREDRAVSLPVENVLVDVPKKRSHSAPGEDIPVPESPPVEIIVERDLSSDSSKVRTGSFDKEYNEIIQTVLDETEEAPCDRPCDSSLAKLPIISDSANDKKKGEGLPRSAKRKAVGSSSSPEAGPSGFIGFSPIRSDLEELPVRSIARRRRILSEEECLTPHAEKHNFPGSRIKTEPQSDVDDISVVQTGKDDVRISRSGKKIIIDDSIELLDEIIDCSDEDIDTINTSINSLGGGILDNLNEIDKLRVKSKKLQGPISGRMKKLLQRSKESVSVMIGRITANSDIAFLRMRNRELSNDYNAMEAENRKLKLEILKLRKENVGRSSSGISSHSPCPPENNNDPIDKFLPPSSPIPFPTSNINPKPNLKPKKSLPPLFSIPPPPPLPPPLPQRRPRFPSSSTAVSPLPSPLPPTATPSDQGDEVFDFNSKADRFFELKNDMLQMVENMSMVINKYFEAVGDNDISTKIEEGNKKKTEGRPKKLRIAAQETIPQKLSNRYKELITNRKNKEKNDESNWTIVESKKKKVKKKLDTSKPNLNEDTYLCEQLEFAGGDSAHTVYSQDDDPPRSASVVAAENRRNRISSLNTPIKKRRPPTTSAVLVTGKTTDFSYSEALKSARQKISLKDLGIDSTRIRQSFNGGMLIQISGEDKAQKADKLARKLNEVLTDATISRPIKRADVRIIGFDSSVTVDEIKYALANNCDVSIDQVKVSAIRSFRNGVRVVWASLPLTAALKIENFELKLGWTIARVEVMDSRPLQCFRCWEFGHSKNNCKKNIDRSNNCFKCSEPGHMAKDCTARLCCIICKEANFDSSHRIGSRFCQSAFGSDGLKRMMIQTRKTS